MVGRGLLGAAAIASLVLAGCGGDDGKSVEPTTTTTTRTSKGTPAAREVPDPQPWLLAVQELPTGWSASTDSSEAPTGICDGPQFSEQATAQDGRSAKTDFDKASEGLSEGAYAFPSEQAATAFVDALRTQIHSCQSWTSTTDKGIQIKSAARDMSFPAIGDESIAWKLTNTVENPDVEVNANFVVARSGPNVVAISYLQEYGDPDIDTTQQFAQLAFAQLP